MNISILGTRGEIEESAPRHSKHSGILVNDELLIDVGESEFLSADPRWILITHFHPDHAFFVKMGKEQVPAVKSPIYPPESPDFLHEVVTILNKKKKIGPYTVIPIPTHHSKRVKSQAYVIKRGRHSFLYTGDLIWIDKKYHELIGRVDLVITEASFVRKGGMVRKDPETEQLFGHNGVPNLIHLLRVFSTNMLFTHFGSWFFKDVKASVRKLKQLGEKEGINVIVGYDGMRLRIDKCPVVLNPNDVR